MNERKDRSEYKVTWVSKYGGLVSVVRGSKHRALEIAKAAATNGHSNVQVFTRRCPDWQPVAAVLANSLTNESK